MRCAKVILLLVLVAGTVHGSGATDTESPSVKYSSEGSVQITLPNHISFLTLAVTIIGVAIGLFGFLTFFGMSRMWESVRRERDALKKERESDATEMRRWQEEVAIAKQGIRATQEEINRYARSVLHSAGAFHPSGAFLSKGTTDLLDQINADVKTVEDNAEALKKIVGGLAELFLANAEYGLQVQKLFTSTERDEVKASVMYLSQKPATHSLAVLQDRLKLEESSEKPDVDVVKALAVALNEMTDALGRRAG